MDISYLADLIIVLVTFSILCAFLGDVTRQLIAKAAGCIRSLWRKHHPKEQ